jgi:SPX domain protein involved in polyphosphate accumulation
LATKLTFNRLEKKFILTEEQYLRIKEEIDKRFDPDEYGETTICNLYYDTPDYLLITRSVEKPVFKEKLRLRTYGIPNDSSAGFIEVKRKFNGTVYKRRMTMPLANALKFLKGELEIENPNQINKEMQHFLNFYKNLAPMFYVSYDRSAFFGKDDRDYRITFDRNLTWRGYDLDLTKGVYGESLLGEGEVLMEIKVPTAIPLWLTDLLSEMKVYTRSFSKVGNAFMRLIKNDRSYIK